MDPLKRLVDGVARFEAAHGPVGDEITSALGDLRSQYLRDNRELRNVVMEALEGLISTNGIDRLLDAIQNHLMGRA